MLFKWYIIQRWKGLQLVSSDFYLEMTLVNFILALLTSCSRTGVVLPARIVTEPVPGNWAAASLLLCKCVVAKVGENWNVWAYCKGVWSLYTNHQSVLHFKGLCCNSGIDADDCVVCSLWYRAPVVLQQDVSWGLCVKFLQPFLTSIKSQNVKLIGSAGNQRHQCSVRPWDKNIISWHKCSSRETVELYLCTQKLFGLTPLLGKVPLAK